MLFNQWFVVFRQILQVALIIINKEIMLFNQWFEVFNQILQVTGNSNNHWYRSNACQLMVWNGQPNLQEIVLMIIDTEIMLIS